MPTSVYIARQPIYNRDMSVHGYELLYRAGDTQQANVTDGELATSQLLVNALMEIGLPHLVGDRLAFVNLTERFILDGLPSAFTPGQIVLEVLEDVAPTAAVVEALSRLKAAGHTIALDDFEYSEAQRPLLALADLIKLDVLDLAPAEIARRVRQLAPFQRPLLAEKVETREQFQHCLQLGFTYFQGYFFCKPDLVQGGHTPACRSVILQMLARLQDPDLEFEQLADLIARDVSFAYRILRYINSAAFGLRRKVDSIQHAATLIGLQRIKTWLTILALSQVDDKPHELMLTSLIRARLCELLATEMGVAPGNAFTIGLFSTLDALTDQPLETVLAELPLAEEINQALIDHTGTAGRLLHLVLAYEAGDWETVDAAQLEVGTLSEAYLEAVEWSGGLARSLVGA